MFSVNKFASYITCLWYSISLFNSVPLTLSDVQCKNQVDCNDGKNLKCGICANNDDSGIGRCTFPFPYKFIDGAKCSNITDSCEDRNNCSNHGSCVPRPVLDLSYNERDLIPGCYCETGFYGRICEFDTPKDAPGNVFQMKLGVVFVGFQEPFTSITRFIYTRSIDFGVKRLIVFISAESDDGVFRYDNAYRVPQYEIGTLVGFSFVVRLPYKPFDREANFNTLQLGDKVLGYLSTISLKVKFFGFDFYQLKFAVFVSYQDTNLVCNPVVTLSGCASRRKNENIFLRSNHIKISSNVIYIANGNYVSTSIKKSDCKKNAKYHWRIWDSDYHYEAKVVLEYYEMKELSLDPYSLNFTNYKVLLEVTSMQEKPSQNFAYCYFSVKYTPLVAIIDGGSERTVAKPFGLTLNTSRSHDPNMPPDKQSHMQASWSCVDVAKSMKEICNPFLSLPVSNSYIVPSEVLSYGTVYNITLKVWTNLYDNCKECGKVEPAYDFAIITISNKTDDAKDDIFIQCLLNCNKNVVNNQQLYLKVKTSSKSNKTEHSFKWTYYEEGQTTEKDTTEITVEGLPSIMFLVKENTLMRGKSYVIVVRALNKDLSAKYRFQTQEIEFNGNCSITPNSGIRGLTPFNVQCENFSGSPMYEFYDKTPEEAQAGLVFNGRMLGTSEHSQMGELKHFRVTRGQILVYVIDNSGLYIQKQYPVEMSSWNVTEEVIGEIFQNLTEQLNQGESAAMLEYISAVSDVIPGDMDKSEILNKLLGFITLAPTDTLAAIKLTTSTLTNVLKNLNKPVQLAIKSELMRDTLHIVRNQTYMLSKIVSTGTDLKGMSPQEVRLVVTYQLDCLHAALMCKDPKTVGITEFDFDLKTLGNLMDSSEFVENAIDLIKDILTVLQRPGLPPTKISSTGNSYTLWVVENDDEYNLTNYLSQYKETPVVVSNKLLQEFGTDFRKNQEDLAVRVATLDENIFWWYKSDIKSNLVSVSLAKHSKNNYLSRIRFVKNVVGIQISLTSGLNSTQINGHVMPYKYSKTECSLEKDLTIDIHRLDPEPQSLILLTFLFPQTNGSLLVHVERNYRPDCYMMINKGLIINENSPTYRLTNPIVTDNEPTFYFVGIVPESNVSVTYTFEINTTVCQYWSNGHWSSEGCRISHISKTLEAHCECDHFSIFAAAFPVPPQEIDLFADINLFLTVFDNPLVVSFVLIVLMVYLICCLWAFYKDKKDERLKNVIILEDNFPEDNFPYLLAVYTSSRINAGTTSHVGIKIKGSLSSSRAHILSSKERKVLKRNYDDWFLLYCPEPLGDLQSIHLWHDNSGSSPDWFCDKVIVYDLKDGTEIVCVVEQWVALRLTYFPEAIVTGASDSEVNNVKRIFLDNCVLGFREGHTLLCILLRHPRSEISRLQRISVLMCCVMTSMLCSIMFYSPQVDDHEYSVGLRDFYISVQSLVVSLICTALVLFAFKRSYKYKQYKKRSTLLNHPRQYKELEEASVRPTNETSAYTNYVRFVSRTMKGHPLIPAQLENSQQIVVIRKTWRLIAWVLCTGVIIICSFFIMLYGLKLGLVKSKIWLSSVLFTLSEDFFVSAPARIIFFSVILSSALQKVRVVDNHRVEIKDVLAIKPQVTDEQIGKLLIKRSHQMYAPLRADFKNEMLIKKELWENWWTVIDFTVALCFILVASVVVFILWSSHYYNNSRVKTIVTTQRNSESFFDLRNMSQVNTFLEESILRTLYITFWYNNKDPITEKDVEREYWATDFTHTMVGHQRYRQIRVVPVKCKFKFLKTTRKCLPHYNGGTEDKGDYGSRWKPAQWHDIKQPNSSWKYTGMTASRFSTLYRLCGESGVIFHNGGYLSDLGPTMQLAQEKSEMLYINWQDQLTRAVFVEFTLYNINVDYFSQVTMIVEYLISGEIQLKAQVVSVESKMKLSFWNLLFVAFVVYYMFRSGYLINRQGLMEYIMTSSRNRSRLVVVFLGALSIIVAIVHFFSSTAHYNSFINRGYGDSYFDFDGFVYWFLQLRIIMSFLLVVAIFRTILIFRGGRTILNYFYTFTISLPWICWLTVVICMFLLLQVPLIILLNIFSFYSIEEIVANLRFTQYFKSRSLELKYLQVFLYFKCLVVNISLTCYIFIFMHYFRIARHYKIKRTDRFNLISFVLDKIKITKRRK